MSVQSYIESQSPIWQNKDLGPDSSIVYINNNSFNLDNTDNLSELTKCLKKVEMETNSIISIHRNWIKIKNSSAKSRKNALNLINAATNNSCKEIFLPSVSEIICDERLSSPSPPPTEETSLKSTKSTAQISAGLAFQTSPKRKSGLTRSNTETQISSLQKSKSVSTSPFSVLLPSIPKTQIIPKTKTNAIKEELDSDLSKDDLSKNENEQKKEEKKRYSVDFLLLRSDVPSSKKFPPNWKDLNEKFPSICFCGKVLSYFNPYKYHEHWEKTKIQNFELHDSSEPVRFSYRKKNTESNHGSKAYTDDYLNLQTTLKDFNNNYNNYAPNKFRNNYTGNEFCKTNFYNNNNFYAYDNNNNNNYYKKNQLSFDQRQNQFQLNQAYYQQENQMKRRPKFHFTQRVFE